MPDSQRTRVLSAVGASVLATGIGVTVNLATAWKTNILAWVAVVLLTSAVFVVTYAGTGLDGSGGKSKFKRSTRFGIFRPRNRATTSVAEGVHLEFVEETPDGRRVFARAYTEEAAQILAETRRSQSIAIEPGEPK